MVNVRIIRKVRTHRDITVRTDGYYDLGLMITRDMLLARICKRYISNSVIRLFRVDILDFIVLRLLGS